jgi:hypothetical protein
MQRLRTDQIKPITITQTAHTLVVGNWVYFDGGVWVKSKADVVATAEVVGVVVSITANTFDLATGGYISGLTGLVTGEVYFLSSSTAGVGTLTAPTGVGQVNKPVFMATSTTAGYILNYRGVVLGATPVVRTIALVDAAVITPNCDTTDLGFVTITANRTIANPAGSPSDDQKLRLRIKQDATGSRLITAWGSNYRFAGGVLPTMVSTPNKTDYLGFNYNSVDGKWDCTSFIPNL